jgi:hypothetical protein
MDLTKKEMESKNKIVLKDKTKNKEPAKPQEPKKENNRQIKEFTCPIISGNINYII